MTVRALLLAIALLWPALAASPVLAQTREPILIPEISQHEVVVRQGFTGANLLLYGAVLQPDGTRATGEVPYDIVVVLKGPT